MTFCQEPAVYICKPGVPSVNSRVMHPQSECAPAPKMPCTSTNQPLLQTSRFQEDFQEGCAA